MVYLCFSMKMRKISIIIFFFSSLNLQAQDDYVAWSSIQIQTQLGDKTQLNFKPIIRHNNDLSRYQNFSVDLAIKQSLGKGWSAMGLTRSWFLPGGAYRHFLWADLAYTYRNKSVAFSNRLRYHWALEINDNTDPDYVRWSSRITFRSEKKLKFYFQIEPWYRTEGFNQFQRIRYEPGFNLSINKRLHLDFNYRIEKFFNVPSERQFNVFVTNLLIII